MRSRSYLLILAAMLLVLPATGIVNAEETEEPAITEQVSEQTNDSDVEQATDETLFTPAESLTCEVQGSTDTLVTETYTDTCGQCSTYTACRGVPRGTPCGTSGRTWCIPRNTLFCPGTQDWNCQCATYYN